MSAGEAGGSATPEVVAMGRTGVDVYPLQHGVGLEEVSTFAKFLGGSATNVAVAVARHGHTVRLVTKVGNDAFGRYVRLEAERLGVDPASIAVLDAAGPPTPVTFCEVFPPDDFPLWFYRWPTAPDLLLEERDLPLDAIRDGRRVLGHGDGSVAGALPLHAPRRLGGARSGPAHGARPRLPPDVLERRREASAEVGRALEQVTVAVGNREECEVAVGESDPHRAADALLDRGLELAVVKQGPRGVLAATRNERVEVEPFPVEVVNGLGAGDSFGGALVPRPARGWDLERTIAFANVAGAIVAGRLECSTAMPTTAEVETALAGAGR